MPHQVEILIVMVVYLVLLISWGIYQGRKVKSSGDYSIGGRKMPGWVAALSERATGESSWALLGLPGAAYAGGLMEIWTAIGCVAGIITSWAVLSWRLQREAQKYDVSTFTDYLAKKHSEQGNLIRVVSSLVIVFFFFFYVGAQFLGGGKTLYAMFGLKPVYGMVLTAAVIIPYTIYGGFRSVVYTDVVQAIVMIVTLIVGPIAGMILLSRGSGTFYAHSIGMALHKAGSSYTSLTGGVDGFASGVMIFTGFSWFFGYLGGQPQLTTRFMSIKNHKQAKQARNVGIAWTLIAYVGALCLGWIGIALFGPEGLKDQEFVMPMVLLKIFPPVIAGLLITGAIAAMISTADSLLILSATELSNNILMSKSKDKKKRLLVSRISTALLAVIALILAFIAPSKLIYTLVSYVWAGIGGTFSVVILLSLFWKKFNGTAAIITIISGVSFTIIWISSGLDQKITSRVLTFFVALIVAVLSTYIFGNKNKKRKLSDSYRINK